jgi:hypothetical protein
VAECSDPRTVTNRQIRGKEREIAYKKETRPVGEETNKNGFFLGCSSHYLIAPTAPGRSPRIKTAVPSRILTMGTLNRSRNRAGWSLRGKAN